MVSRKASLYVPFGGYVNRRALFWALVAAAWMSPSSPARAAPEPVAPSASRTAAIKGVIRNEKTGKGIKDALVVIRCTCLQDDLERRTNSDGLYLFKNLPPGVYTIQVFAGDDGTKPVQKRVGRGERYRFDASVDPETRVKVIVKKRGIELKGSGGSEHDQEELSKSVIDPTGDAVTTAVSRDPLGGRDGGGVTIANGTSAEVNYTVNDANVASPTTGQIAIPTVQEFVDSVEVTASGYMPEHGQASSGRVEVRRLSGTNKLRGRARFTFTPRLAKPRFIEQTDAAVRAVEVPDYQMQGVVSMDGPIIKNKLFWSAGINIVGGRSSLIQSFHSRVDKDGSGGFLDCPYENGANDCADGGDYILTTKFAEQKFRTQGVRLSGLAGLDWQINPRHRIEFTAQVAPSFLRRAYRRPPPSTLDPDSFGSSPTADPLSGLSTVANGVVDDHFGWDRGNAFNISTSYTGRVADDKLEIDATFAYLQTAFDEAWRLDNPDLRNLPATRETDNQGESLFELLDDEKRLDIAPGVREACNDRHLPGLACPVRVWMSGGLGQYVRDRARRAEGRVSLTHFLTSKRAGSHQLKYGTQMQHEERRRVLRYSGHNEADFYGNCTGGLTGDGGEWCFDPRTNTYDVSTGGRVDNHRLVLFDSDNPNNRTTQGYGRVRKEDGDLRAIATPLGDGARVPKYDEKVSSQFYSVYLQDRWNPMPGLLVAGGLRWDIQDMRDILGRRAVFIWDNVAPRASMAYDWTQEGRSRLFASYGWFYQKLPLALLNRVFGGQINVFRSYDQQDCEGASVEVGGVNRPREEKGQPTEWCPDSRLATTGLTEGSTVPKLKGQYEQQFQVGYEQEIVEDLIVGVSWLHKDLGRAVEDVSTDNGNNFIIANPGTPVSQGDLDSQRAQCNELQTQLDGLEQGSDQLPKVARELGRCQFLVSAYEQVGEIFARPRRTFDAFTLHVRKRLAKRWTVAASYTYSRHIGNYDGFVDPISGAINLGSSLQYDTPQLVRNSFGPLAFNVPHRVKFDAFYTFDLKEAGALTLGSSIRYNSGFPLSTRGGSQAHPGQQPIYVVPRGKGGRLEPNYQVNMSVFYGYPLSKKLVLAAGVRLFNVTNAKAILRADEVYTFQNTRAIAGGDLNDLKHAKAQNQGRPTEFFQRDIIARQGNYGVESAFQTPLTAQFDIQLYF